MTESIQNDHLVVEVSAHGAELQSLKSVAAGREYLWQGDKRLWGRRSPLLFPIVGGLWQGRYRLHGAVKSLPKHGFMQDAPFRLVERTDTSLRFRATDTAATRALFPFPFVLDQTFTLAGSALQVTWQVATPGRDAMPFQIGGHPGLMFDGWQQGEAIKGYFAFTGNESPTSALVGALGCLGPRRAALPTEGGLMAVTDDCFLGDSIIIDQKQVSAVTLCDVERRPLVSVRSEAPVFLMWSPQGVEAPFVCIEPWYGLPDHERYAGEFADRPYTNVAEADKPWQGGYTIEVAEADR